MSQNKRILGDFNIFTIDGDGNVANEVVITTDTLRVNGNFVVDGYTTEVVTTEMSIEDNTILLNRGETGAGITSIHSGIEIDRGTELNVGIRYDDNLDAWMATQDGAVWQYIITGDDNTIGLENVVEDLTPQLGGDLDVNGMGIVSDIGDIRISTNGNGEVIIEDAVRIKNQVSNPVSETGYNKLYSSDVASGGTGLYVVNDDVDDELISRKKAMVYGLIF